MELCVVQKCLSYGGLEKVVRFGRHCLRDQADFKRRIWQTPNSNAKEIMERVATLAATLFVAVGLKKDLANIFF